VIDDRFDWNCLELEDIVAPSQIEVAAYLNQMGDLVIRRRPDDLEQDDVWVVVGRIYVRRLVEHIMALYGLSWMILEPPRANSSELSGLPPAERSTSRDPTGAERQRRFRERRKQRHNGGTNSSDTNVPVSITEVSV
jgi:hypothetical protein